MVAANHPRRFRALPRLTLARAFASALLPFSPLPSPVAPSLKRALPALARAAPAT